MITCRACHKTMPPEAFYTHPLHRFGRMTICKPCHIERMRLNRRKLQTETRELNARLEAMRS